MSGEQIVALVSAIGSTMVALVSLHVSAKKRKTDERSMLIEAVTENRMVWISTVRDNMAAFCEAYLHDPSNKTELCRLKMKLFLYMRYDREFYRPYMETVNVCCYEAIPFELQDVMYERLILTSQFVLATVWIRVKEEGARGETDDEHINSIVRKKTSGLMDLIDENRDKLADSQSLRDELSVMSNLSD